MDGAILPPLSPLVAILIVGYLAFVGVVKGTSGFGSGLLAVPVLVQLVSPDVALAALTLTLWVGNLPILVADGIEWGFLKTQRGLVIGAGGGVVIGLAGLAVVPVPVVYLLIAAFILVFLVLDRNAALVSRLTTRRGAGSAAGWIGGIVTGALLTGGPIFVSYLHAERVEKTRFATTMAFLILLMTSVRIASLAAVGSFDRADALLGLSFLVPLGVGVIAGTRLRAFIPQRRFRRLIALFLLAIGATLAYDGLTALFPSVGISTLG